MKGLMATKIGMTQVFTSDGTLIPVTVLHVEPNVVLAVRTKDKDGYVAAQLGFKTVSEKNLSKAHKGQFKKVNAAPMRHLSEIRDMAGVQPGQTVSVNLFQLGETVDVEGTTKGRGFTGAIRRWNMKIGPMSHGAGYPHRFQGSLGGGRGGSSAQHVFKGKRMSGHYGVESVTVENLTIMGVDEEKNVLLVKGAVPGPKRGLVRVMESQKRPGEITPIKLVDTLIEARKNALLEEARHLGVALDLDLKLSDMQRVVAEARAQREKENEAKAAAEAAEAAETARQAAAKQEQSKAENEEQAKPDVAEVTEPETEEKTEEPKEPSKTAPDKSEPEDDGSKGQKE